MEDERMTSGRWTAARHGAAGVLGGLALAFALGFAGDHAPTAARANTPTAADPASGVLAVTSGDPAGGQWLYLIETKKQAMAVYRIDPRKNDGAVQLVAARQYKWDLQLAEYNNAEPSVRKIQSSAIAAGTANP